MAMYGQHDDDYLLKLIINFGLNQIILIRPQAQLLHNFNSSERNLT